MSQKQLINQVLHCEQLTTHELSNLIQKLDFKTINPNDLLSLDEENNPMFYRNFVRLTAQVPQDNWKRQLETYHWVLNQSIRVKETSPTILECINNIAALLYRQMQPPTKRQDQYFLSLKYLKIAQKYLIDEPGIVVPHKFITYNNMARIYLSLGAFEEAHQNSQKGLMLLEPYVFEQIKVNADTLVQDVILLINGYIVMAKSIEKRGLADNINPNALSFYRNGSRLGKRHLGVNHILTQKVINYELKAIETKVRGISQPPELSIATINEGNTKSVSKQLLQKYFQLAKDLKTYFYGVNQLKVTSINIPQKPYITPDQKKHQQKFKTHESYRSSDVSSYFFQDNQSGRASKNNFKIRSYNTNITDNSDPLSPKAETTKISRMLSQKASISANHKVKQDSADLEYIMKQKIDDILTQKFGSMVQPEKITQMEQEVRNLRKQLQDQISAKTNKDEQIQSLETVVQKLQQESITLNKIMQENKQSQETAQNEVQLGYIKQIKEQQAMLEQQQAQQRIQEQQIKELNEKLEETKQLQQSQAIRITPIQTRPIKQQTHRVSTTQDQVKRTADISQDQNEYQYKGTIPFKNQDSLSEFYQSSHSILPIEDQMVTFSHERDEQQFSFTTSTTAIFSKSIFQNNQFYQLECQVVNQTPRVKRSTEAAIQIRVRNNNQIQMETLEFQLLKNLILHLDYQSVLPQSIPLGSIQDFKTFVQYLVLPFVSIQEEGQSFKIEVWPRAPGLLKEELKLTYMGAQEQLYLYHIQQQTFRVVLPDIISYDIHFDDDSFATYFSVLHQDEYAIQQSKFLQKLIESYDEADSLDQQKSEANQIIDERKKSLQTSLTLPSVIVKDQEKLVDFLQAQLLQWDKPKTDEYLAIKVWNNAQYQRLCRVQKVQNSMEIKLQNLHESHAPSRKMAKVKGWATINESEFQEKFGVDISQYKGLTPIICNLYELHVFDKPLDEDDYDRYKENAIYEVDFNRAGCHRQFEGNDYLTPITQSYLGVNDKPVGIKMTIYDPNTLTENGVFFSISPDFWLKPVENEVVDAKKKKRIIRYSKVYDVTKKYWLPYVLARVGYKMLINACKIDSSRLEIKSKVKFDRLENHINFSKVLEILEHEAK